MYKPRLIGSSNKPITSPSKMTFTKAAFLKFDENVYNHYRIYCRWTISADWHNICLVCAIPMLCHWFCHSKRYRDSAHFLYALKLLQNATNNNSRNRSLFLQKLSKIFLLHLQIFYFNLAMLAAILYLYKFQNCFTVSINFQIFFPKYMHSSCTKPMKESLVYCFV